MSIKRHEDAAKFRASSEDALASESCELETPLAPEIAEKVAPGAAPILGAVTPKAWKVGDRVCFASMPLLFGRVFRVSRVYRGAEPSSRYVEIEGMAGVYGSHVFVPAPAETISLPAAEVEPRGKSVIENCQGFVKHSRDSGSLHVSVPCGVFEELIAEVVRLKELINTPELIDFVKAVQIEAVHQRERWGSKQDDGKTAADWFWLLGYLAGKAIGADKVGNTDKVLHHIITTAAACANWHAQVLGKCDMRPGIETPAGEKS